MPSDKDQIGHAANDIELTDAEKAAQDEGAESQEAGATDEGGDQGKAANDSAAGKADAATDADAGKDGKDAAAADAGSSEGVDASSDDGAQKSGPVAPFAPVYAATASDRDFDKELADVATELKQAKTKLNDGDFSEEEYEAEYERLQDRKSQIRVDKEITATRAELSQQTADQAWAYLQNQFFSDAANAPIRGSAGIFAAWEAEMQAVVNDAAAEGRQITDWEVMNGARQRLVDQGFPLAKAESVPTPKPEVQKPDKPDRTPPLGNVPAGIGAAPSVADVGVRGKADDLVDLDIEDIEDRMAKMGDDARDALLRGTPGAYVD